MKQYLNPEWYRLGVEHIPVLARDSAGRARIVYRPIWQPAIERGGFDDFLPDDNMLTEATLAALDMMSEAGNAADVPIHFALLDRHDPDFNERILDRFGAKASDISTPHDEAHTLSRHDFHPNQIANALYARRLASVAEDTLGRLQGGAAR